ncbi:hypothetical protein DFH01_04630 [Falsiroseomonas bella]|uniref:Uncharacterized protein n=1 Tax=Falsiroseomonas bella TaxID=2184016 RepID=A0A317FKL1_9PROT|nr:hypothetical protein DFH01_04630 [Falsiroseomonas bella]
MGRGRCAAPQRNPRFEPPREGRAGPAAARDGRSLRRRRWRADVSDGDVLEAARAAAPRGSRSERGAAGAQ